MVRESNGKVNKSNGKGHKSQHQKHCPRSNNIPEQFEEPPSLEFDTYARRTSSGAACYLMNTDVAG
jgi:hypothetical protein